MTEFHDELRAAFERHQRAIATLAGGDGVFGEWDAPHTDGLPIIDPPIGHVCRFCRTPVLSTDNGARVNGWIEHRECALRCVLGGIGHMVDHAYFCAADGLGPDAGLGYRVSAIMVWNVTVAGVRMPSRASLLLLAGKTDGE